MHGVHRVVIMASEGQGAGGVDGDTARVGTVSPRRRGGVHHDRDGEVDEGAGAQEVAGGGADEAGAGVAGGEEGLRDRGEELLGPVDDAGRAVELLDGEPRAGAVDERGDADVDDPLGGDRREGLGEVEWRGSNGGQWSRMKASSSGSWQPRPRSSKGEGQPR